jgi:hypothetical protein
MTDQEEIREIYETLAADLGSTAIIITWPPKEGRTAEAYQAVAEGKIGFELKVREGEDGSPTAGFEGWTAE